MCWTLTPQELGATMSACVVKTDTEGYTYCDDMGTVQGDECNKPTGGGGGGGGKTDPFQGDQGDSCTSGPLGCAASCSSCI